jgi:hypothetical protein
MVDLSGAGARQPQLPTRLTLEPAQIITGERVQGMAEVTVISRRTYEFHRGVAHYAREMLRFETSMAEFGERELDRLVRARSVFLYTHDFDEFADVVWPQLTSQPPVLITHNSDGEVSEKHAAWLDREGAGVRCWLAQNAAVRHPRLRPVPIGIANSRWPHGNPRSLARAGRRARRTNREPLSLFAQFSASTNPARAAAAEALRANFPAEHVDATPSLKWRQYTRLLSAHQFSACPRGNGIDTHRLWESLYLGVVPIVERTTLSEHWKGAGLPLVLIDDWSEVTPARLRYEADRLAARGNQNALQLSTYREALEAALAGEGSSTAPAVDDGA